MSDTKVPTPSLILKIRRRHKKPWMSVKIKIWVVCASKLTGASVVGGTILEVRMLKVSLCAIIVVRQDILLGSVPILSDLEQTLFLEEKVTLGKEVDLMIRIREKTVHGSALENCDAFKEIGELHYQEVVANFVDVDKIDPIVGIVQIEEGVVQETVGLEVMIIETGKDAEEEKGVDHLGKDIDLGVVNADPVVNGNDHQNNISDLEVKENVQVRESKDAVKNAYHLVRRNHLLREKGHQLINNAHLVKGKDHLIQKEAQLIKRNTKPIKSVKLHMSSKDQRPNIPKIREKVMREGPKNSMVPNLWVDGKKNKAVVIVRQTSQTRRKKRGIVNHVRIQEVSLGGTKKFLIKMAEAYLLEAKKVVHLL